MALNTQGKVIGDVLKQEGDSRYSREKVTIDLSQTIVIGTVLYKNPANGRYKGVAAAVDEVQTLAITGTLTAGSFVLSGRDYLGVMRTTPPIAFNANTAAIQAALDDAFGANAIVAGGTAITASTLTFSGANYTGKRQQMMRVETSGLTGEDDASVTLTTAGGPGDNRLDHNEGGVASAVALEEVTTDGATPQSIVACVRDAQVDVDQLGYGTATKADVVASLKNFGIICLSEPAQVTTA